MDMVVNEAEPPSRLRQREGQHGQGGTRNFLWLALGATGVVFGDTGTSPLYTYSGIFASELHATPEAEDVKGAFSMIFWVLTWTVCIKYLMVVMKASHHGEGGILVLMQVALQGTPPDAPEDAVPLTQEYLAEPDTSDVEGGCLDAECVTTLGMLGCAALVGDSVLTPSISVLSALDLMGPLVGQGWKVAMAVIILLSLFAVQKHGSKQIGQAAGPVMVCWFLTIGVLGIRDLLIYQDQTWEVIRALSPALLIDFWTKGRFTGVLAWKAMGGVVLSITGAEALYSDMGHFGAKPISAAWFMLVYPCLVLQYMGQSAALMSNPDIVSNPFASTVPPRAKCLLVLLAVLATIQASQALISGTFTLFSQAHALGLTPRLLVVHTNADVRGQVYIPEVNWALMTGCVAMCVLAQTSGRLAGAYGITVTSTFLITTLLLWMVLRHVWRWSILPALLLLIPMLLIDVMFWSSNLGKIFPLGWIPVAIGSAAFLLMHVQRWGNRQKQVFFAQDLAYARAGNGRVPTLAQVRTLDGLQATLSVRRPQRMPGAAVYLTPAAGQVPWSLAALAQTEEGALAELILLLHVVFEDVPFVPEASRCDFKAVDADRGLFSATLHFGWAEPPGAARARRDDEDSEGPVELGPGLHAVVREVARAHRERYPQLSQLDVDSRPGEGVCYVVSRTEYAAGQGEDSPDATYTWLFDLLQRLARSPSSIFGLSDANLVEVQRRREL